MAITINLTEKEESLLREQAAREGLPAEDYILHVVRHILPDQKVEARLSALHTLLDDDEAEQKETGEYLLKALDEDRLSFRKLYP